MRGVSQRRFSNVGAGASLASLPGSTPRTVVASSWRGAIGSGGGLARVAAKAGRYCVQRPPSSCYGRVAMPAAIEGVPSITN